MIPETYLVQTGCSLWDPYKLGFPINSYLVAPIKLRLQSFWGAWHPTIQLKFVLQIISRLWSILDFKDKCLNEAKQNFSTRLRFKKFYTFKNALGCQTPHTTNYGLTVPDEYRSYSFQGSYSFPMNKNVNSSKLNLLFCKIQFTKAL